MTNKATGQAAGLSDIGQLRKVNEDSILIEPSVQLYAIADGMGGHGAGDVASQLALKTLKNCISSESVAKALANENITDEQALSLVFQCVAGVNTRIHQENVKNGQDDGAGMGTTLVGFCIYGDSNRAISFNVGDSRLYSYKNDELEQLTIDHTMYRVWQDGGRVGPAPPPNLIVRAIGLFDEVEIDLAVMAIEPDTNYLLCSDGLSGMISDKDIASVVGLNTPFEKRCKSLVERANEKGGYDNISVVLFGSDPK